MNDDEWLMQQLELEGTNDFILGGNLVRIPDEEVEKILSSPMNNDECMMGENLVRPEYPEDNKTEISDATLQIASLE